MVNILLGGTFVTIDEPTTLMHHCHQKSMFTLEFTLSIVPAWGFGRCMMTCIHHYQWNVSNIRLLSLYSKPTRLVSLGFGVWELAYFKALCVMLTCR